MEFATEHFIFHSQEPLVARFGLFMADNVIMTKIKHKVGNLYSATYLNWTPISEWNVVRCDPKNGYKIVMCFKKIGLCV